LKVIHHPQIELEVLGVVAYIAEIVQEVLQAARWQTFVTNNTFKAQLWGNGSSAAVPCRTTVSRTLRERSVAFENVIWTFIEEDRHGREPSRRHVAISEM